MRRVGFARPEPEPASRRRQEGGGSWGNHGFPHAVRANAGEGSDLTPRCLTIATSDSGGGAGIQADLKAFAAAGCHGMSALVALTAQNTVGVTAIHELPPDFVTAQLEAVFDDIGVDAAKTGMLFSRRLIETIADFLEQRPVPLVVDPVMVASSGAQLLEDDAVETLITRLLPLATVATPNLAEARVLAGVEERAVSKFELADRIHALGASAVIVTGGHGEPVDHFFDGEEHVEIPIDRHELGATHGAGCTHSATLCACLARGLSLEAAAEAAARAAGGAVAHGLAELGEGDGPVDVFDLGGVACDAVWEAGTALPARPFDPAAGDTSDLDRTARQGTRP
jgi:hydroxymethylpyrimidine/phosphomethylpyrimidine kinase